MRPESSVWAVARKKSAALANFNLRLKGDCFKYRNHLSVWLRSNLLCIINSIQKKRRLGNTSNYWIWEPNKPGKSKRTSIFHSTINYCGVNPVKITCDFRFFYVLEPSFLLFFFFTPYILLTCNYEAHFQLFSGLSIASVYRGVITYHKGGSPSLKSSLSFWKSWLKLLLATLKHDVLKFTVIHIS